MKFRKGILCGWMAVLLVFALSPHAQAEVTLRLSAVEGGRDLNFGTAHSFGERGNRTTERILRQIRVTINSTGNERYQLFQRVNRPWVNDRGERLPIESVKFFITETAGNGEINRFPNPSRLSSGEREIFLSNSSGGSEDFLITYTVQLPVGQQAGRYRTNLTFRVVSQ
jgi:hypothetical protein